MSSLYSDWGQDAQDCPWSSRNLYWSSPVAILLSLLPASVRRTCINRPNGSVSGTVSRRNFPCGGTGNYWLPVCEALWTCACQHATAKRYGSLGVDCGALRQHWNVSQWRYHQPVGTAGADASSVCKVLYFSMWLLRSCLSTESTQCWLVMVSATYT